MVKYHGITYEVKRYMYKCTPERYRDARKDKQAVKILLDIEIEKRLKLNRFIRITCHFFHLTHLLTTKISWIVTVPGWPKTVGYYFST